jgi:hypothetical protein
LRSLSRTLSALVGLVRGWALKLVLMLVVWDLGSKVFRGRLAGIDAEVRKNRLFKGRLALVGDAIRLTHNANTRSLRCLGEDPCGNIMVKSSQSRAKNYFYRSYEIYAICQGDSSSWEDSLGGNWMNVRLCHDAIDINLHITSIISFTCVCSESE